MAVAVATDRNAPVNYLAVFGAILNRDITVTIREFPAFLAQVILQPLFMLVVCWLTSALPAPATRRSSFQESSR
jgi:hypothetical protein